jgi:hypothetical protein
MGQPLARTEDGWVRERGQIVSLAETVTLECPGMLIALTVD